MRHELSILGKAYRLRPVTYDDAGLILELRSQDTDRMRFLHAVSPDLDKQRQWLAHYFEREGDYYWVIERIRDGLSEGLISLYDRQTHNGKSTAEWGRWVLRRGSMAAPESAFLVYQTAFERLNLDQVYCITVLENTSVLSFHDSCGLARVETLKQRFELADGLHDGVRHQCDRSQWPEICRFLSPQVERIAARIHRVP